MIIFPFLPSFPSQEVIRMLNKVQDARLPRNDLVPGQAVQSEPQWKNLEAWNRGPPVAWMRRLHARWSEGWSYDRFLARLQRWPQYKAMIGTQSLHFIYAKAPVSRAKTVVVLLAGWPSTPYDFNDVIGPLNDSHIDVVCPSYPGSAFSDAPPMDQSWKFDEYADLVYSLLTSGLGYPDFAVHGYDWGHYVARLIANKYQGQCRAVHLAFLPAEPQPGDPMDPSLTPHERNVLLRGRWWKERHSAYYLLLCNNAQLVGLTIYDNPLGLLSWLGEKWYICADQREATEYTNDDTCLDLVSLVFLTETALTCQLPYVTASCGNAIAARDPDRYIVQPTGFSSFPYEVMTTTLQGAKTSANIVYYKAHTRGGHFSPAERPLDIAEDIIATLKEASVI